MLRVPQAVVSSHSRDNHQNAVDQDDEPVTYLITSYILNPINEHAHQQDGCQIILNLFTFLDLPVLFL